ncbi:tetratricopeptide repeat protein [Pseudonocardia charpentierae]|uniref:Tetratricopeptide repeat protein n=1 Tax=Pseudonocardia charpentierae TaxID=3075545 RepID=A0ABU2N3D5_9PSEU|nr:tetratricopeptide repeat protein [Pseudonocardia sp. DSM 45834]MDT0348117.1 tetratricopeptide repeat protein [Pseudonocardia sp. DSM 45834]
MTAFVMFAVAGVVLAGQQAAISGRESRDELRQRRAEVLTPVPPPAAWEGRPELPALLAAQSRLSPFSGRSNQVKELLAWCEDPDGKRVHLVTGVSGVGKTRLAIEAAAQLPPAWAAGFAVRDRVGQLVATVVACQEPTLVIVDDADTVPDVAELLDQVQRHEGEPRMRVLLVVRDAAAFTAWVAHHGSGRVAQTWDAEAITSIEPVGEKGDRKQWFAAALGAYAAALRLDPVQLTRADLGDVGLAGEPMLVTCVRAALAALDGASRVAINAVRQAGTDALADHLMEHEMRRWSAAATDPRWGVQAPGVTDEGRADAVLALMVSGATTPVLGIAVLRRVPRLSDQPQGMLDALVAWTCHLYPASAGFTGSAALVVPQPEFLAAALVARCANQDRVDLVAAALSIDSGGRSVVFAPLVRAAVWFPAAARLVVEVLEQNPAWLGAAIEATSLAGPRACLVLGAHLAQLTTATAVGHKEATRLLLIVEGAGLGRVVVALHRVAVAGARANVRNEPTAENRANLARSLYGLGNSLRAVGEYRDALTIAREAVALRRELAAAQPAHYTADLAASLNGLGASLSDVGEYRDALTTLREAVALRRELAAAQPAHYCPDLAASLNGLGVGLWVVGQYRAALSTFREAVALYRELAAAQPAYYTADLALSLNGLGASLLDVGEYRDALTTAREAVALYRELAAAQPAHYTADLARSLNGLSNSLHEVGEYRDALAILREAVALRRELAAAEPDRYTPDLALSLCNVGISLRAVGEYRDALTTDREAVALRRKVAEADPARYTPDLAESLAGLGNSLRAVGEYRDALITAREAIALYRELAASQPVRYTPDLAESLHGLGASFWAVGEYREAVTTLREAAALYRELAAVEPARYTADLALSLNALGVTLRETGELHEGLSAAAEAVAWWGRLNRMCPAEPAERYKAAQRDLARLFSEAGEQVGAAVLAEQEAARRMPADDPTHATD